MSPDKALNLLRSGKTVKLTKDTISSLSKQFKFIVDREQFGDKYVDGSPQWLTWYGLAVSGTMSSNWNKLSESQSSMPLDASAIAPTNVTHSRVSYLAGSSGTSGQIFRFASSILMNVHEVPTAKAIQLAVIAASPSPIDNEDAYERLWRRYRPFDSDDRMDLSVIRVDGDEKEVLTVR